jgi:hypothetical protein
VPINGLYSVAFGAIQNWTSTCGYLILTGRSFDLHIHRCCSTEHARYVDVTTPEADRDRCLKARLLRYWTRSVPL